MRIRAFHKTAINSKENGAIYILDNSILKVQKVKITNKKTFNKPGVLVDIEDEFITITTKTFDLIILQVTNIHGEIILLKKILERLQIKESYNLLERKYEQL